MRRMYSEKQIEEVVRNTRGYDIANLVDQNGNPRFAKGDITIETISGVSQTFGRWALSGFHLIMVVAISVANGTTIANGTKLCDVVLPDYIKEKIVAVWGTRNVDQQNFFLRASDNSTQALNNVLMLKTNNGVSINIYSGSLTLTADRSVRIEFDLEID